MIPKRTVKREENVDAWLMSYADMITLLLCFFIIFVSVSEPKRDKLTEIADGMVGKFGAVNYNSPFRGAMHTLQSTVEKNKLYRDIAVEGTTSSLSVELATHRFFKGNTTEINEEMLPVLQELASHLKSDKLAQYTISIESHTDDTPPQSGLYSNNWELSAMRAAKLSQYFIQQGFPAKRLKAIGYGDARPKVPNLDSKGHPIEANRAQNQRITIRME